MVLGTRPILMNLNIPTDPRLPLALWAFHQNSPR